MTRQRRNFAVLQIVAASIAFHPAVLSGASASPAVTGPAELPPDGFAPAQYIDSAGCVFVRAHGNWTARLARDGQAICGYPPTLSARRTAPDTLAALQPDAPEARADRVTRELVTAVMTGLQAGELAGPAPAAAVADRALSPRRASADVSPQVNAAVAHLPTMIAAAPALRQAVARTAGSSRLCTLLVADKPDGLTLGGAAMGACGGLADLALNQRHALAPVGQAAGTLTPIDRMAPRVGAVEGQPLKTVATSHSRSGDGAAARRRPGGTDFPMRQAGHGRARSAPGDMAEPRIPAGARYVQVGVFADDSNAQRAAGRLSSMGLPVARGRMSLKGGDVQVIMAGPFNGRQSLVRALHHIRRGGFKTAYPR